MNSAVQVPQAVQQQPAGPVGVDDPRAGGETPDEPGAAAERPEVSVPLEVHRNGALAALVGVLASAVAIAWLSRAAAAGSPLQWVVVGAMALVAVAYLRAALDARTPLLVADAHGVRVRLGRAWRGLPWDAVAEVEHRPRRGLLRDGRLAVLPRDDERFLVDLDRSGRRQARLAERLYGAPLGVPLGPSTRLVGAAGDVVAQLEALADPSVRIVDRPRRPVAAEPTDAAEPFEEPLDGPLDEPLDEPDEEPAEKRAVAAQEAAWAAWRVEQVEPAQPVDEEHPFDEAEPADEAEPRDDEEPGVRVRDPRPWLARVIGGRRRTVVEAPDEAEEVRLLGELPDDTTFIGMSPAEVAGQQAAPTPDDADDDADDDDTPAVQVLSPAEPHGAADDRVRPIARPGQPVPPLVVDDFQVEPAADPVIGPDIAAARTRLALTVDQLAERTRIRPHVIESIEVDDFTPCGGDFYARGHLRTLARVLGVPVAPLLARYDERYAHAPVDARRVFEAELASAGVRARSSRGRGGPNWSVLVAAFMAVVLCWSVAQLVLDTPPDVRPPTPTLRNGSAGVGNGAVTDAEPVPVLVGAVQGGATIEISDGNGETVFAGDVAFGESRALDVVPPVRVRSDDGGAVEVTVAGEWRGRMGRLGEAATQSYAVTR